MSNNLMPDVFDSTASGVRGVVSTVANGSSYDNPIPSAENAMKSKYPPET